ncbi:hypothetical protein COB21_03955 [Candidatus Aerophobetes bacterium]|uniref:BPL/LPL catalytic domain-containing protein n=1 Tax=Aerophobetes bacterium TaxID=2030807 RepID=A0A2A4X423_UNCAE|nr:MAG: hypothetical protein COB21_03955 [Candidatus Aerophobetes bacterium]
MSKNFPLSIVELQGWSIEDQLVLEEKLLRTHKSNYCLINYGAPKAIVLGISGKTEEHLTKSALVAGVPIIKRYSGGGSVVTDNNTLFVSFIFNKSNLPADLSPHKLMEYSATIFTKAFSHVPLKLKENDLVIGERKCVGNAQYFQKDRVSHHCTLLYDYNATMMRYLAFPPKVPKYRQKRAHEDFLCCFKPFFANVETMAAKFKESLMQEYAARVVRVGDLDLTKACRIATKRYDLINNF